MYQKLTKQDLEKIGIVFTGDKAYPNLYNVPCLGEVNLYPPCTIESILLMAWKAGNEQGVVQGKTIKILELKKVLDIED